MNYCNSSCLRTPTLKLCSKEEEKASLIASLISAVREPQHAVTQSREVILKEDEVILLKQEVSHFVFLCAIEKVLPVATTFDSDHFSLVNVRE